MNNQLVCQKFELLTSRQINHLTIKVWRMEIMGFSRVEGEAIFCRLRMDNYEGYYETEFKLWLAVDKVPSEQIIRICTFLG